MFFIKTLSEFEFLIEIQHFILPEYLKYFRKTSFIIKLMKLPSYYEIVVSLDFIVNG